MLLFHYVYEQIEIVNLFKQINYYVFEQIGNLFEHIVNLARVSLIALVKASDGYFEHQLSCQ